MPPLSEKVTQSPEFFVVGGPVAADRPCYIRRRADDELLDYIAQQHFAYVLAPRAMGKSSLMGRTVRRLRAEGQHAAVVDLTQIGSRGEEVDSARWHYSIAYRICRELRLKVDLQSWWQDRGLLLNEQRLLEFFWDIVLANTEVPVTVFFDEAGRAIDRPFSAELFSALHACYTRRVTEPEFSRLNFVVLGVATPEQLCPDPGVSPFVDGKAVELGEFSLEECARFAPGFAETGELEALFAKIHSTTLGQPYLTQKLARAVARRGGRLQDVDPALNETFLAPGVAREEPLLSHMRVSLTASGPRGRQAARILSRIVKGGEAIFDPASAAQRLLRLAGFVSSDENGMLRFRNRIVEQVFSRDSLARQKPVRWRQPVRIAVAAFLAFVVLPYWYLQLLPRSDIQTLRQSSDYALSEAAYRRLNRLPGLGGRADGLLADSMTRRSRDATSFAEVQAADTVLRRLDDRAGLADELLAAYWLRQAQAAARAGERDTALVMAKAAVTGGLDRARNLVANLVGGDYQWLDGSLHLPLPAAALAVDWDRGEIVVVDQSHRIHRAALGAADSSGPVADARANASRLTALQHVGVTRGVFVDDPGIAGSFELRLTVEHDRSSDLLVRVRAPSGQAVDVELPAREGRLEQFVFTASARNGLLRLAEESITGQWELTLFDRLSDSSGRLINWSLRFPGVSRDWVDAPVNGIDLPDPVRTEQISVALSQDGRRAVAIPSRAEARGAASVWDTATGEHIFDLPLADRVEDLQIIGSEFLLVLGLRRATLWRFDSDVPVVEFSSAGGFARSPLLSADGSIFALVESVGDSNRVSLLRVEDGAVLSRFDTEPSLDAYLATGAEFLALVDGSRRGRVIDPMSGALLTEFFHERELDGIFATEDASHVLAVDRAGEIHSWPIATGSGTLSPRDSTHLGATIANDSVETAAGSVAFAGPGGLVHIVRAVEGLNRAVLEHANGGADGLRLSPDADRLVTYSGNRVRHWSLPPLDETRRNDGDVSVVALGPQASVAMLGYRSGEVRVVAERAGRLAFDEAPAGEVAAHRGVVSSLAINSAGTLAASGGSDGLVRIWDVASGDRNPLHLRHPSGPVTSLAFSPDDRWIASAGPGSVRVFDLESGRVINEIEVDGQPTSLAIAADSRQIAIGDTAGNIFLATGEVTAGVMAIRGRSPITALRFVGASTLLASGSSDGDLVLWDTLTADAVEGVHRFPAAIRWIDETGDGAEIHLQSGPWLFRLDRGGDDSPPASSLLLPSHLRGQPALARLAGDAYVGLASVGGGRLRLTQVSLNGPAIDAERGNQAEAAATALAERDWSGVLGMSLDPVSGTVRLNR